MVWKAALALALAAQSGPWDDYPRQPWLDVTDTELPSYTATGQDAVAWVYESQVRRTSWSVSMWVWHRVYADGATLTHYREFVEIDCGQGKYRSTAIDLMDEDWNVTKSDSSSFEPWEPARPQTLPDILRGHFCK